MKKKILLMLTGVLSLSTTHSQVGINTQSPLVGLHVVPFSTDGSTAEGIIAPNLTRAQLIAKDSKYAAAHKGAFVYITAINGTASAKTAKITTTGYYYFDGTEWKHFNDKLQNADNGLSVNNATVQLGGDLTKATTIDAKNFLLNIQGTATASIQPRTSIGSNIIPPAANILNLQTQADTNPSIGGVNATGGLGLPRVLLVESTSLKPFITSGGTAAEKVAHKGMMVFHIGGNSLQAGTYSWTGATWMRFIDKLPTNSARIFYLTKTTISGHTTASDYSQMKELTFSDDLSSLNATDIILPETGSYAFAIRLFQRYINTTNSNDITISVPAGITGKNVMYLALFVNNVCRDIQILSGTINKFIGTTDNRNDNTITSVLALNGNAGDKIVVKFGSYTPYSQYKVGTNTYWPCAVATIPGKITTDATNLIFWKL